jgi:hypothetical protein
MKPLFNLLFIVVAFCPLPVFAQKAKLVSSIRQCWSGGIAGRHGCNYNFVLEIKSKKGGPVPDTIWITGRKIALVEDKGPSTIAGNMKSTTQGKKYRFEISVGTSFTDYSIQKQGITTQSMPELIESAPIPYIGVALITYRVLGERKYFVIGKITKEYPAANYP